jgi:cell division septation protein DedD
MIGASPVVTDPKDPLTTLAKERSTIPPGPLADEGHAGAFVLQVASFRTDIEAQAFATQLRQRGHKAYVEEANLPGRGTWHRVRVGPFKYGHDANKYRAEFESKEHIVPFVIEAEKERKLAEAREASLREKASRRR